MSRHPQRIRRILAVGSPPADRVRRLSRGESFTCVAGTEEEHEALRAFCLEVTEWLDRMGMPLDQLSPSELWELLARHRTGESRP